MKTVTVRYEFPDTFKHEDIIYELNGSLTEMSQQLADQITYTILEKR